MRARSGLSLFFVMASVACTSDRDRAPAVRGAFGLFFGGEVQELSLLEVSSLRPSSLGFRLTFPAPSAHDRRVHYEVVRAGPSGRRVTFLDDFAVPGHERRYDRPIPVPPEAELGTWNLRVECDGVAVIDRAIVLKRIR